MRTPCLLRKSTLRVRLIGFLLVAISCPSLVIAKDELRSWADKSGKNKIKAKFVKLEDDVVTLENEDGDEIEIELKKLSPADAKFATEAAKESEDNPFKSKPNDPFKPKGKSKSNSKSAPRKGGKAVRVPKEEDEGAHEVAIDLNSAQNLSVAVNSPSWKVEVSEKEAAPSTAKLKPISIPGKTDFFEKLAGVQFSHGPTSKHAVVGYMFDHRSEEGVSRIVICDLTTGRAGNPAVSPGKMAPVALHDDGKQVLMRRDEFGHGKHDKLEVWIPKGGKVEKSVSWIPYGTMSTTYRDVAWAEFLDADTVATCSSGGLVVVWKYPDIEPIYKFETAHHAIPAISPDRKLLAFCTGKEMGLVDLKTQEIVAQTATPSELLFTALAFSPSGKRLACVGHHELLVWDVATGELQCNISCAGMAVAGHIQFADEQFALVGDHYLIDLESQLKLWSYDGAHHSQSIDGVTYFVAMGNDKSAGAVISMRLPHPAAKDLLGKTSTQPDLFILKAGTTVRINVDGIPDASKREFVTKALTERLKKIGCEAGPMGTIDLVATQAGPKDSEIRFSFGKSYKFKEFTTNVKFVYQGQPVWENARTNKPGLVSLEVGQGMEEYLRPLEKVDYNHFETVEFPRFLQKPSGGKVNTHGVDNSLTLGHSRITPAGIR